MLTWYIKNLNRDIREYNDGLSVDSLRERLTANPMTEWNEKARKFKEVDVRNINNYGKLVRLFFSSAYEKICKINYRGLAHNMARYMKNIDDIAGLEDLKKHYSLKTINFKAGKIGFRNDLDLDKLMEAGLSKEWIEPVKLDQTVRESTKSIEKDFDFLNF